MTSANEPTWSAPDSDGIRTCLLDVGAKVTLRGRRRRRSDVVRIDAAGLWPAQWRTLLRDWMKQGGERRTWDTLLKKAGGSRAHDAWSLVYELLRAGLVELEEVRKNGRWQPLWVEFPDMETLRELCGLTNRESLHRIRAEQEDTPIGSSILEPLAASLVQMPVGRAVRRHTLLMALATWISEERNGTRRDFALFASGDTKGLSSAEWDWLEAGLPGLEEIGISRHTPAVWLRAPVSLVSEKGSLDLCCVSDCIGLTPETLCRITAIEGRLEQWLVVENRTLFERVARLWGESHGVLWLPGFAPSWWKAATAALVERCPAPVCIACDPDPAGIEIAMDVGVFLAEQGFCWSPWLMEPQILSTMPRRKALTEEDQIRLARLRERPLPEPLASLARLMEELGEKGEQEGVNLKVPDS